MDIPGIHFPTILPRAPADPDRMDIAMFVGFLPLRAGDAARAARARVAAQLARDGWQSRVAATGTDLTDLPVRVGSIEEVEALFDTGGRVDRRISLVSRPLFGEIEVSDDTAQFVVEIDGRKEEVSLALGTRSRAALRDELADALPSLAIFEGIDVGGRAALEIRRREAGPGSLTVYANAALGFPVAAADRSGRMGAPTGVALRSFFAAGGREAILVRMGDPPPYTCGPAERVASLAALVNEDFAIGAASFADLLDTPLPELPGAFPPREPWHGLAHLHGLEDVAMALLPDIAELVAAHPGARRSIEATPRPKAAFDVCAEPATAPVEGEARASQPGTTDAEGLELWSRLMSWAARQVKRISHEVTLVGALPLLDGANGTGAEQVRTQLAAWRAADDTHFRQLQIAAPWIASAEFADLPGGAAPADGVLAGHIAASTLERGAWRTVAGRRLQSAQAPFGALDGLAFDTTAQLSMIGHGARGPEILSDRTAATGTFNKANLRRLTALVLRAARRRGRTAVFEPNGAGFWREVRSAIVTLMRQLHSRGALRGSTGAEAFEVRCGRDTMSQADIDAGRAIAHVAFAPADTIERIEVSLLADETGFAPLRGAA